MSRYLNVRPGKNKKIAAGWGGHPGSSLDQVWEIPSHAAASAASSTPSLSSNNVNS
jgi:hypothetical protein